jgi:hypothetical protein
VKSAVNFFLRSIPLVTGIILTLTAMAFLVEFANIASFDSLAEEEFRGFVLFALGGLPLMLFGINLLSNDKGP